jgi:hypothetical protein
MKLAIRGPVPSMEPGRMQRDLRKSSCKLDKPAANQPLVNGAPLAVRPATMSKLRLKIFSRDSSDWRYQVVDGCGDVRAERRFLPDRSSAERIGEHEHLRLTAELARTAAAARWRAQPVLKQDEPAEESVRARPRWQKPWKTLNADRSIRPLRAR